MADVTYSKAQTEAVIDDAVSPKEPQPVEKWMQFYDTGVSIMTLRADFEGKEIFEEGQGTDWYAKEAFATATATAGSKTILMCHVLESQNKSMADQKDLLPNTERMSKCREWVLAAIVHFLATGERIGEGQWFRFDEKCTGGWIGAGWRNGRIGFNAWEKDSANASVISSILV